MNFGDIVKKGESALAGKDGKVDYKTLEKDAQQAYSTYNSTEGTTTDKAKAAYSEYQKNHSSDSKSDAKSDSKSEK